MPDPNCVVLVEESCNRAFLEGTGLGQAWKEQLQEGAANVFGADVGEKSSTPAIDIKALHAKIGELTLENDFLEGALNKAGLLHAKR